MIEVYEIYRKLGENEVVCLVKLGKKLNGYPGVIHGGIRFVVLIGVF